MLNIKVIGSDCSNGVKLKKIIKRVNDIYDNQIDVEYKNLTKDLNKYNIRNKPALIINGILVSQGKVIGEKEIMKYLKLCEE